MSYRQATPRPEGYAQWPRADQDAWCDQHFPAGFGAAKDEAPPSLIFDGNVEIDLNGRWTVKNLLPDRGVAVLAGASGAGKTFVALDLARCVATGKDFVGHRVKRAGGVLWLACEGEGEVPYRLAAMRSVGLPGASEPMPFAHTTDCPHLTAEGAAAKLVSLVANCEAAMRHRYGVGVVAIFIDTLAAAAGFTDENSAADTQKAMNCLAAVSRQTGALVVAIDHHGKTIEAGLRGSSAKIAAADCILTVLHEASSDGGIANRRLIKTKMRGGITGPVAAMELVSVTLGTDEDGDEVTSAVVEWTGHADARKPRIDRKPAKGLTLLMRCFDDALANFGGKFRPFHDGPWVSAVLESHVRDAFMLASQTEDSTRDAQRKLFTRSLAAALNGGELLTRLDGEQPKIWRA